MTDALRLIGAALLMLVGTGATGYAIYLEMLHAEPVGWWDRAIVLAPCGLVAAVGGVLLSR